MKKLYMLALVPLLGLASCGTINELSDNHSSEYQLQLNDRLLRDLKDDEILLNLTVNGLYNGEKGSDSEEYLLENYVIINASVGDSLPGKDVITSTVEDVEFTSWQFATSDGELKFTTVVEENQKYYQAYFTYLGEGEEDQDYGDGEQLSSEVVGEDRKIYVKLENDWTNPNIYLWNSYRGYSWPGETMDVEDENQKIYYHNVSPIYENVIFNSNGAQTADLKLYDNVNIYIISASNVVSYGWYENGTITPVEIEQVISSEWYVRGSFGGTSWPALEEYRLVVSSDGNSASITVTLNAGDEFKVATSDWSSEFSATTATLCDGLGTGSENSNIRVTTSGSYYIVINNLTSSPTCTITKA